MAGECPCYKALHHLPASCQTYKLPFPPIPIIPTFLPVPAPFLLSGENTVSPPHSIEQASAEDIASGMGKTNCSCAIIPVE